MEWVETTGRSVDEAKEIALDQLGVDEHDAEFVVVSEPRAGLFGRMRGEARVRARVKPTSPRPKRGRSRRQASEARGSRRGGGSQEAGGGSDRTSVAVAERADVDRESHEHNGRLPSAEEGPAVQARVATSESARAGARRRSRPRGSRGRGPSRSPGTSGADYGAAGLSGEEGVEPPSTGKDRARAAESTETKEETVGEHLSLEEQGESAREFIEGLVGLLGLRAAVSMSVLDSDTAQVSVDGPELGILIGPGGGTLAALQELARAVVQGKTAGRSERILVDVAGYRAKRAAALQRFTKQIAEDVLSSDSERALEPMSASDRKIVHDTINEIEGVVTRSVGEEPRRYIVVSPAPAEVGGDGED